MDEKEKETRNRILASAEELFMQYGFKGITMDEIAKHLGISKKTIYQYFEDKDGIVRECISNHLNCEKEIFKDLKDSSSNPVEEFIFEIRQMRLTLSRVHPAIIFELKKYHPKAWEIFQSYKHDWIIKSLIDNLTRGKALGLYREDIEPEILARMRVEQVSIGFESQYFPPNLFDIKLIQTQFIEHFLHGILTDKGREILNQINQHNLVTN